VRPENIQPWVYSRTHTMERRAAGEEKRLALKSSAFGKKGNRRAGSDRSKGKKGAGSDLGSLTGGAGAGSGEGSVAPASEAGFDHGPRHDNADGFPAQEYGDIGVDNLARDTEGEPEVEAGESGAAAKEGPTA